MSNWWYLAAALAILLFWRIKVRAKKNRVVEAFDALEQAKPWLHAHAIDEDTLMFSTYSDYDLAQHPGAIVIVGDGRSRGKSIGFAIEVANGRGVVRQEILSPSGIASHHKSAALLAKTRARTLIDVLSEMAHEHRSRHPSKEQAADQQPLKHGAETSLIFMAEMPSAENNKPTHTFTANGCQLYIYKNPKTLGQLTLGIPTAYTTPNVSVVVRNGTPLMIIRTEENDSGCSFLCLLKGDGTRHNLGFFSSESADVDSYFLSRVIEVVSQMKFGGK